MIQYVKNVPENAIHVMEQKLIAHLVIQAKRALYYQIIHVLALMDINLIKIIINVN